MGFYDDKESAEGYIEMAKGYDGKALVAELNKVLAAGSTVLEIGMGPGVDLDLASNTFKVTGSDSSPYFVQRFLSLHPDADVLPLDAITLPTKRKFDALYSNKVLHHLNDDDLIASFMRQSDILNKNGLIMHSFWNGEDIEEHQGLIFYIRTTKRVADLLGSWFSIIQQTEYSEFEAEDSHWLLARRS